MDLNQKLLKEYLSYSPESGEFTWIKRPSNRVRVGCRAGTASTDRGHRQIRLLGTIYKEHRLAWLYVHGEWPCEEIDHINQDPSDNRLENLRLASHLVNCRNMPRQKNNTSGVTGVRWDEDKQAWRARIYVLGREIHIGRFKTKRQAISARREAEALHGFHENHGRNLRPS